MRQRLKVAVTIARHRCWCENRRKDDENPRDWLNKNWAIFFGHILFLEKREQCKAVSLLPGSTFWYQLFVWYRCTLQEFRLRYVSWNCARHLFWHSKMINFEWFSFQTCKSVPLFKHISEFASDQNFCIIMSSRSDTSFLISYHCNLHSRHEFVLVKYVSAADIYN